jgi:hypothetical protein
MDGIQKAFSDGGFLIFLFPMTGNRPLTADDFNEKSCYLA